MCIRDREDEEEEEEGEGEKEEEGERKKNKKTILYVGTCVCYIIFSMMYVCL